MFNLALFYLKILENLKNISSQTLGWIAILLMHCAFIPNIIAVLLGVSDRLPSVDVVIFVWTGLLLMFLRSVFNKDNIGIITGGMGFFIQALLLALVVFK